MDFSKAFRAALHPAYWRGLKYGVVPTIDHAPALSGLYFATVLDIGANKGQFSLFAREAWPDANIFAVEPLADQAATFRKVHGDRVRLFTCAVGDEAKELVLHVASRRDSSSLLPLGDRQKNMFQMREADRLRVPVERLDSLISGDMLAPPTLLKIDVQGFEYEVLRGAIGILPHVDVVYTEVSFVELYSGQRLYETVAAFMSELAFEATGEFNTLYDVDGLKVQADVMFARKGAANIASLTPLRPEVE